MHQSDWSDRGSSLASRSPSKSSATSRGRSSACVFWLGGECYALDIARVGEVVSVDTVTHVPMAPSGVLGMCNLRGIALAIVDLATVLELPRGDSRHARASNEILVLRFDDGLCVGAPIDRVEAVVACEESDLKATTAQTGHGAVVGLLELGSSRQGLVASVLDAAHLKARLDALKFVSRKAVHVA